MSEEGAIAPLQQTKFFGHAEMLQTWQTHFSNNTLHHGLLVTGPTGIGKATLTFHFLKWLFKQQSDRPELTEKQILAGSYPGLKIIERLFDEKRQRYAGEITLDAVEPIFDFLRMSVISGGYRAIVIDGADRMNRNAQNTILKLLEEPPKKTLFFLLAEQPGGLLPTIRSRCMKYTLTPLSPAEFSQGMTALAPDIAKSEHTALYALAEGSLGQAIHWHTQNWTDLYGELVIAVLSQLNGQPTKIAMKWAEQNASPAQDVAYELLQDLMLKRFSHVITSLQQNTPLQPLISAESALLTHWQSQDPQNLLKAYDQLTQILRTGDRSHLDRKLVLLQAIQAFLGLPNAVASPITAR